MSWDHDPLEDPQAMGSLSVGSLLVFICISITIAAAGYYGVKYVYNGLPPRVFLAPHETR